MDQGGLVEEPDKDDKARLATCFYIPQLLGNITSNVMDSDTQHHDHHDSLKETPNQSNGDGDFSVYTDDTMFTISSREDVDKICRICYGGESTYDKLITPCLCSGSTKYAHETCLLQWINYKGSRTCELCLFNMEIHCKGIKPFWKWQKPKSCDAVTTLSLLYSVVMFMFLAMVIWIAKNRCISALCITLYCLCIVAVAYFCYCCGYLHCMKPYCRAFWEINRRWSVVARQISLENEDNFDSEV